MPEAANWLIKLSELAKFQSNNSIKAEKIKRMTDEISLKSDQLQPEMNDAKQRM